jgi:NADPH:quinone reductase-like Zn-dependent oxidoreductase
MRAVWYDRQGVADDVLVCGELPTPEAGHGEVRVRLEASDSTRRILIGDAARQRWNTHAS